MSANDASNVRKPEEAIALNFRILPRTPSMYAYHMTVQPTEYEVTLSFFEIIHPIIMSDSKEALERLKETGVTAECVVRVTVARERFQIFAEAMQEVAAGLLALKAEGKEKDAESN